MGFHLSEEAFGEEIDVLGEEAEQDASDEVGDGVGVVVAYVAKGLGEFAELRGGVGGEGFAGDAGAEGFGVGESGFEEGAGLGFEQVIEADVVDLLDGVGEVGMDSEGLHVGDDEEGRVFKVVGVVEELGVGLV
ncbi:MAG: hypothetical protein IH602_01035 [Bryobacteraceae bacterium]|nr:hypothetical protein [Bryobacteraceae bacterium]